LNFEELPEIPEIWCDFLRCRLSFSPASRAVPALVTHADAVRSRTIPRDALCRQLANNGGLCYDRTLENIQRLQQPESVVVLANIYPGLFGGPAYQLFKCLTAIKICEELALHKLQAVPVCWVREEIPRAFSRWSVRILNNESELCSLELEHQETGDSMPGDKIAMLLAQIEESGRGNYDPEVLEILNSSFGREPTLAKASARLIAALMKEWGMIVIDPHSIDLKVAGYVPQLSQDAPSAPLVQCSILPVIVTVIDPFEVDSFAGTQMLLKELKQASPMAWPQASATIIDSRSRRILDRYGLNLSRLYAGADAIIGEMLAAMPRGASEKLGNLKLETETRITALGAMDSAAGPFAKAAGAAREKIAFQLDRMRENFEAAFKNKEQTIRRQMHRVCNSLAPNGRIQEQELAGIQMPLRYSCAALRSLYERLDVLSLEHQLISMD
jgi:uncharacterized protein YllA (UPF0747 family)